MSKPRVREFERALEADADTGSSSHRLSEGEFPVITTVEDAQDVLGTMTTGARDESLSALPAGPYSVDVFRSSWDLDVGMVERGVDQKCLYQADAVTTPEILAYLSDLAATGVQVRVRSRVARRMLIIDARVAIVALNEGRRGRPWMYLEEPALLGALRGHFLRMWDTAQQIGHAGSSGIDHTTVREIIRMLRSGTTDQIAALEMGVSERTVRRRVAAVMELLGASSRFEAGAKAAQAGWV